MTNQIASIPEIQALDSRQHLMRIPPEMDVPLTPRVRQIIDSPEFQRLKQISQLGLVSEVYPAAHHTRFEHSLGVYRMALRYLQRLRHDERFAAAVSVKQAEIFIIAALVHDVGHWPFCHPIEDLQLMGVPEHEQFASNYLLHGEIADVLRDGWNIDPSEVVSLLSAKPVEVGSQILQSMLSGPIDIDKMDYLMRDSLHAGVPYGRNFDQERLIGSLCLNASGDGLALTDKGKTAAEMMVFCRYVMFSEVYWHHAVRAATAMLQRAFFLMHDQLDLDSLFRLTEREFTSSMIKQAVGGPAEPLLNGLFGPRRRLFKQWMQLSFYQSTDLYQQLTRRPYTWLAKYSEEIASRLSHAISRRVAPDEILIDAPPLKLEVQFQVDIYFGKEQQYRALGDVSPVVQTLAKRQFDDYVKSVRVLVEPDLLAEVRALDQPVQLLTDAMDGVD